MGAAEAIGLGAATGASRIAAPALGLLANQGRKALRFARGTALPESASRITGRPLGLPISPEQVAPGLPQRAVQQVVDNLLPSRFVTQQRRRAVVARVLEAPPERANEVIKNLIRIDTSSAVWPRATKIADTVRRAIGRDEARLLGFENLGPRQFVARVFESASPVKLKKRLRGKSFEQALTVSLAGILDKATRRAQDGRRIIEGEALLAAWRALPNATRALYPKATQEAVENFGAFAAVSKRVPELAAEPTLVFGPSVVTAGTGLVAAPVVETTLGAATAGAGALGAGVAFLTARSLMNPKGLLNRYLTNEKLPPEIARAIGRQAVTVGARLGVADDEQLGP